MSINIDMFSMVVRSTRINPDLLQVSFWVACAHQQRWLGSSLTGQPHLGLQWALRDAAGRLSRAEFGHHMEDVLEDYYSPNCVAFISDGVSRKRITIRTQSFGRPFAACLSFRIIGLPNANI